MLAERSDAILAAYVGRDGGFVPAAARGTRGADATGAGASGVLRFGAHRRRRGFADERHRRAAADGRRGRRRPGFGPCFQDRTRCGRREDRLRPHVLRHRANTRPGAIRPERRAEGDRDQRLRRRPGRSAWVRVCRSRSASCGVSRRSRSATWSARRGRMRSSTSSPRRPWRRSSFPAIRATAVRLRVALGQLAEQDPLINVRQDDTRQEISVSLYGEVQKEVIGATLAIDFGLDVGFRKTTTICIERPIGTGAAVERLHKAPNPFLATVGLRIEPAAVGSAWSSGSRRESRARCRSRSSGRSRTP